MSTRSELDHLEDTGHWLQALQLLHDQLRCGLSANADKWHRLGRLFQRLGRLSKAERAYLVSLRLDPRRPLTYNNLALLALNRLDSFQADYWLEQGLLFASSAHELDLLSATGCSLRLFQLRHADALAFSERQLSILETAMALSNRATCLHRLGRLEEAVNEQERAIRLHLSKFAPELQRVSLPSLVGVSCGPLQLVCTLQTMLMTYGIFRLCLYPGDSQGLKLLLAGQAADPAFWLNPARANTCWDGSDTSEVLVWDDQGFGDTLQNLSWITELASRVECLRLWLRPSLLSLIKDRFPLPTNCVLEAMGPNSEPWALGLPQVGTYYLPIVMQSWSHHGGQSRGPYFKSHRSPQHNSSVRIGLVWSAGRHKAPQPERCARVRDVPPNMFFDLAQRWQKRYCASLVSLQIDGHDNQIVQSLVKAGHIDQPLSSTDWLETAEVLETLDLLVSVDTSVAHLAGALGIPTVLLLGSPADWRWGQTGDNTFLYSCMHLARCVSPGDWSQALIEADIRVDEVCLGLVSDAESAQ